MSNSKPKIRCAVVSALKHDYIARGIASHPRFELVVVADDPHIPQWAHERNQQLAASFHIPYVTDIERALRDYHTQVAIVSPEAERHSELSIRAAECGQNVVQDKPLATSRADAERLVNTIQQQGVKFLMWNRNFLPAVIKAHRRCSAGAIGNYTALHADFYFAKDAGPPKTERKIGFPPLNWQAHQIAAHVDGSDGGLGSQPMGELAIEGIYPLAYLRMLSGARVRRVFARATAHFHQLYADNQVEDLASVTLEMEQGIIGSLALGRIGLASHPSGGEIKLHLIGSRGALVIRESLPVVGLYYRQQLPTEHRERRVAVENDFLLAENFAECLDGRCQSILDVQASFDIYITIEAALKSCRRGEVVQVC